MIGDIFDKNIDRQYINFNMFPTNEGRILSRNFSYP